MHGVISRQAIDCQFPFTLLRPTRCYPDTVALFVPTLWQPPGLVDWVKAVNRGDVFPDEARSKEGGVWGWRIVVQQPSDQALLRLDAFQEDHNRSKRHKAKVVRLDIPTDLWPDGSKLDCRDWFVDHLLLRYRKAGPMYVRERTI